MQTHRLDATSARLPQAVAEVTLAPDGAAAWRFTCTFQGEGRVLDFVGDADPRVWLAAKLVDEFGFTEIDALETSHALFAGFLPDVLSDIPSEPYGMATEIPIVKDTAQASRDNRPEIGRSTRSGVEATNSAATAKATLQRSCGWFPPRVYEVGIEVVDDQIVSWCAYDGDGRIECGLLPWSPEDASRSLAHELTALHRFDPGDARLIAEDLVYRLHLGNQRGP